MTQPTSAFIVRPFGEKEGIDFELVDRELVSPVLDALGIEGRTTGEIARAGNIRTDMFERLLLADVVIADISIHNANVYYELGIRHALRPRTTILIRANASAVPFDLQTDRYLQYDERDPAASRVALTAAVTQSGTAQNADSPVYLLLPALEPTDPEAFRPVPEDFGEAVRSAGQDKDLPLLAVLDEEAKLFDWGPAGSRLVGRAQFNLSAFPDAGATWEAIRRKRPDDPEANLLLGTIFQRLGDPIASTAAIKRVLDSGDVPDEKLAEAHALLGRNAKDRWVADWRGRGDRAAAALRSACLEEARSRYAEAFETDQNHAYSGINALALDAVKLSLARGEPDVWAERFEDDDEAEREIRRLERDIRDLAAAVRHSLEAGAQRSRRRDGQTDIWSLLNRADLRLLTSTKPAYVAAAYEQARAQIAAAGAARFESESAARQIRLYLELGVFTENAKAALATLGAAEEPPEEPPRPRVLVFAGHRIDAPGRKPPRFPPSSESIAADMIRAAVAAEQALPAAQPIEGIAGGASGGDILFHEICAELGIPTRLMLALPRDVFAAESVLDAGPDWMQRFRTICKRQAAIKVLADSTAMPAWLAPRDDYTIWARNNSWTLHTALSRADTDVTLIVLWDGKGGDGPGGTKDMVTLAESRGVRVVPLDAKRLA